MSLYWLLFPISGAKALLITPVLLIHLDWGLLGEWAPWMYRMIHRVEHAKKMGGLMKTRLARCGTFARFQTSAFGNEGQRNIEDISVLNKKTILDTWIRWKGFRTNLETHRSQDENVSLIAGKSGQAKLELAWMRAQTCFIFSLCRPLLLQWHLLCVTYSLRRTEGFSQQGQSLP